MIHLDTSFLIRALVRGSREDKAFRRWLLEGRPLRISAVSWTEFLCGPVEHDAVLLAQRILRDPIPFGAADAAVAARLFNLGGRRRASLVDCMIAATALGARAALATANPGDFGRLVSAGLEIADH